MGSEVCRIETPNQEAYTRVRQIDMLDAPKEQPDDELEEIKELAAKARRTPIGYIVGD